MDENIIRIACGKLLSLNRPCMSDDKKIIVSDEDYTRQLHPVDKAFLNAARQPGDEGLIKIESMEQLQMMAQSAADTYKEFEIDITKAMTKKRAEQVFDLRVKQNYSWRLLAAACWGMWKDDAKWNPPSNQLAGMALCEVAGRMLKKKIE